MAWTAPRTWVTGEVVTAALMNTHVRDNLNAGFPEAVTSSAWSAVLSGTTGGTHAAESGRRWRVGPLQFVWARFTSIVGESVTGTYFVTLPVAASGVTSDNNMGQVVGPWSGFDQSAVANSESGAVYLRTSTTVGFRRPVGTNVSNSSPFAWATGDVLTFSAVYPVA